jgi:predicted nicotinamide N-methyase
MSSKAEHLEIQGGGALSGTLTAHYEVERFAYYYCRSSNRKSNEQQPISTTAPICANSDVVSVTVRSATTTVGSQIVVSNQHDLTGIMIWPATHYMCQFLVNCCSSTASVVAKKTVVELGCGCGLLGVVAAAASRHSSSSSQSSPALWVSTDMDETALQLCQENYTRNGVDTTSSCTDQSSVWVQKLKWGNATDIKALLEQLQRRPGEGSDSAKKFDVVVAADIVYPATCGQVLADLLETVDTLLTVNGGKFYLSFCSRDGPKTPTALLAAASQAGFGISALLPEDGEENDPATIRNRPATMGAKILVLERSDHAATLNQALGHDDCAVFPGLQAAMARLQEPVSEEEWDAPFVGSDDDACSDDDLW